MPTSGQRPTEEPCNSVVSREAKILRLITVSDSCLAARLIERAGGKRTSWLLEIPASCSGVTVILHQPKADRSPFLSRIEHIVRDRREQERFTLDVLCRDLGVSRPTLYRRVRSDAGISPGKFITRVRLRVALNLISEGESITGGALAAGFTSLSTFYRACQNHVGTTPGSFRSTNWTDPNHTHEI